MSIDVGTKTFSFALFVLCDKIPFFLATVDIRSRKCQDVLKRCEELLNLIRTAYNIKIIIVEEQRKGMMNIRIQHFINDFCLIHRLQFNTQRPITYGLRIPKRRNRKRYSVALFEARLIEAKMSIDYRSASVYDVCDAANIGINYIDSHRQDFKDLNGTLR